MSYIQERYTVEQFLAERSKAIAYITKSALSQLDRFSIERFQVSSLQLFEDLGKEKNEDKTFFVFNQFITWLQEEHPEIMIPFGNANCQRVFKPLHSRTIKNYIKALKNILEDCFGLVLNDRQFKRKVRFPQIEDFDPEPLTKEELKWIIEYATRSKRVLYMTLKDSGMRIGEAISIRKKDIDFTKDPVEIHISAKITKTKKARITYITRETKSMLQDFVSEKQDNDLVFATNTNLRSAFFNEEQYWSTLREKIGVKHPQFLETYESNGRHKKNLHSMRAFTATQCANAVNEDFGHGIIGHKKYLGQYIRNQDKMPELYKRAEIIIVK